MPISGFYLGKNDLVTNMVKPNCCEIDTHVILLTCAFMLNNREMHFIRL